MATNIFSRTTIAIGAACIVAFLLAAWTFQHRPIPTDGRENGVFVNDCCGTLELRNGALILNDTQATHYSVGRDARGPFLLPRAYVGAYDLIGFNVDGTRSVVLLRLDRLPHPSSVQLHGGGRAYLFKRTEPRLP